MEPIVPVSLHALFGLAAVILALVSAAKVYASYLETRQPQIRDFAFVYGAVGIDTFFLILPALLWRPDLMPPFLALSSFFFLVGLAFYFRVLSQFVSFLRRKEGVVFWSMLVLAVVAGLGTYVSNPSLELDQYGWARYHFPGFLFAGYLVFAVLITSISSGALFLFKGLSAESSDVRRRGFLLGVALILVGIGILLALLDDTIVYNFFVLAAFLVFFAAVLFRQG